MNILVVEDEPKASVYIERGLRESGYVVDIAEDGQQGLECALNKDYDLIVLDVMMPRRDGWGVLSELRAAGKQTPVLFLTAKGQLSDRVKGLDLGADAYLPKPFAFTEFLAIVRSLLRRSPLRSFDSIQYDNLYLDLLTHRASRGNTRLDLTPKEFQLLSLLARKAGEVLTRTMIASQVWNMNFDSDSNVVDVHIRRLRAKVDLQGHQKLIHTERGIGYVLRVQDE